MSHKHGVRRVAVALSASALAAGLFAPGAAAAPILYGATGVDNTDTSPPPPSNLYAINPDNGAATTIGAIGHSVTALAVDPTSGTLYGVTAGVELAGTVRQLLTINPSTGAGTVVGSLGTTEVEDIAFDARGNLFGWNTTGDRLVRISKTPSGSVTSVGNSGAGITFGGGLAFNVTGTLFGLLNGDDGYLWTVDPTSGVATRGARLTGSPNQTGAMLAAGEFGCDGTTLYAPVNDFGDPPTYLVTINTGDGKITNRGVTVPRLDAIAFANCTTTVSGAPPATPAAVRDVVGPRVSLLSNKRQSIRTLRRTGLTFRIRVDEASKLDVRLVGRFKGRSGGRGKPRQLAKTTVARAAAREVVTVTLKPSAAMLRRLRSEKRLPGLLRVKATDLAGNDTTRTKPLTFR